MDSEAVNFFLPFRRLEPNHENQLTRALLVVLRLSPMAHASWLHLIAPDRQLQALPVPSFTTQTRAVRDAREEDEAAALVSVFLTPETPLSGGGVITESDRSQVLDAVIDYGGEFIVVIENKVAEDDDRQSRELNFTGARVQLQEGQQAVVVLWRDVLEALMGLRERNLVAGAEAGILDDFLTYTEDYFPQLGPFRTLGLARGNEWRQTRRLRQLLGEATGLDGQIDYYGSYVDSPAGDAIGTKAYLRTTDDGTGIELSLYPADTLSQARAFYSNLRLIDDLAQLRSEPDWYVFPNFHFGHMQRGFCWTNTDRDVDEYVQLWIHQIANGAGSVPRDQWDAYWGWLEAEQIARPADRPEFDRDFTHTQRQTASPRPGLYLARRWRLAEAEALNARGGLHAEVAHALDTALSVFRQHPLSHVTRPSLASASEDGSVESDSARTAGSPDRA